MKGINDDLITPDFPDEYVPEIPDRMHADDDAYMEWAEKMHYERWLEGFEDGE